MKLRPGLHAQFLLVMAGALLGVTVLVGMLLHRQHRMQDEVEDLSRDAMGTMASESLQRRGEGTVAQLAESLSNVDQLVFGESLGLFAGTSAMQLQQALDLIETEPHRLRAANVAKASKIAG